AAVRPGGIEDPLPPGRSRGIRSGANPCLDIIEDPATAGLEPISPFRPPARNEVSPNEQIGNPCSSSSSLSSLPKWSWPRNARRGAHDDRSHHQPRAAAS